MKVLENNHPGPTQQKNPVMKVYPGGLDPNPRGVSG